MIIILLAISIAAGIDDQPVKSMKLSEHRARNRDKRTESFRWKTYASNPMTTEQPLKLPKTIRRNRAQYKVIEQRGIAMERRGTLISYNSMDLMSVIVRIPPLSATNLTANCSLALEPINAAFETVKEEYRQLFTQLLQPSIKISQIKLCQMVGGDPCKAAKKVANRRDKRFVAEAMAAGALAIAATSLGLSIDTRIQLDKLETYLDSVAADVESIATELQETNNRQRRILNIQSNILGYIADIHEDINKLQDMLECTRLQIHYTQWYEEILQKLRDILVYPLQGTLSGRLRPTILSPEDIAYSIADSAKSMKDMLTHLPLIFYSSATVTLIGFDMDNLVFNFLIAYPLLQDTSAVLPIYQVFQTGFHTSVQEKYNNNTEEQCLQFDMPERATKIDDIWHTLELPQDKCPIIGIFSVCPVPAYKVSDLEQCIDLQLHEKKHINGNSHDGCKIRTCTEESSFINLKGGIMLRTNKPAVDALYKQESRTGFSINDLTSSTSQLNVTKAKTLWIPWRTKLAAVQVDDMLIHNPVDDNFDARIESLEAKNVSELFKLSQILDTNFESKAVIKEIEQHQEEIESLTYEIDASNKLLDTIGVLIKFYRDPMRYIKIPLIVVGSILLLLLAICLGVKLKAHYDKSHYQPLYTQKQRETEMMGQSSTTQIHHISPTTYFALTAPTADNPSISNITPSAPLPPEESEPDNYKHHSSPFKHKKSKKRSESRQNLYPTFPPEMDNPGYNLGPNFIPLTAIMSGDEM